MLDMLAREICDRRVILFAGAGLSQALGVPSWQQLINQMARELDYDPEVLVGPGADHAQLAEFYKLRKEASASCAAGVLQLLSQRLNRVSFLYA